MKWYCNQEKLVMAFFVVWKKLHHEAELFLGETRLIAHTFSPLSYAFWTLSMQPAKDAYREDISKDA